MSNEEIRSLNSRLSELSPIERYSLSEQLKCEYLSKGIDPYIFFFIGGNISHVEFLNKFGIKEAFENLVSIDQTGKNKQGKEENRGIYLEQIERNTAEGYADWLINKIGEVDITKINSLRIDDVVIDENGNPLYMNSRCSCEESASHMYGTDLFESLFCASVNLFEKRNVIAIAILAGAKYMFEHEGVKYFWV